MDQHNLPADARDNTLVGPRNRTWSIFLISVLGLFLEMLLIRWIGTEIRIFAYLQNCVLVVCFLGLGMGCFTCRKPINFRDTLKPLLLLTLLLAIPLTRRGLRSISAMLSVLKDFEIWGHTAVDTSTQTIFYVLGGLMITFFLMMLLWDVFVPIGRILGRTLDEHPNTIWAYSVNVAGSLLGIWLFVLLSSFHLPPLAWFLTFAVLAMFFLGPNRRERVFSGGLVLALVLLSWLAGWEPGAREVHWSPYQKLVLQDTQPDEFGRFKINVNNANYQEMLDLSKEAVASDPDKYPPELADISQYDVPYLMHATPENVLIVGAGAGNDVAAALRNGGQSVTAVDIDPAILSMGTRYHPEQPYSSPKVHEVNDDARSFFATCKDKFDVIAFGLLDSHTTTTMTNARLDHYVYTSESIMQAKSLLKDRGVLVLSFFAERHFIADRMARVLRDAFGREPISFHIFPESHFGRGAMVFVAGDLDSARGQIEANPKLAGAINTWQTNNPMMLSYETSVATDDWPYIYLEKPHIPVLYFLLGFLLIPLVIRGQRQAKDITWIRQWGATHWHFFLLGAAFMLLEVQNISKASVVLGNTWLVNAIIISGIFSMILFANFLAYKLPKLPLAPVYFCLIASCIGLYFADISQFAFLPYFPKALIVGALTTLPMMFSGIVFIRSFDRVQQKNAALGANLFGALVGALLQSVTFVIGIKALLLIVGGLYATALLCSPSASNVDASDIPQDEYVPPKQELELVTV